MDRSRVWPATMLKAELTENLPHGGVLRQDLGDQFLKPSSAGDDGKVVHQQRANSLSLIVVDHDKGDLRLAGFGDDITPATDDDLASILVGECDKRERDW